MSQINLPDFDDIAGIIDKIGEVSARKEQIELEISVKVAEIFRKCSTDSMMFVNGKAPAVSYIENTFKTTGFNGELIPLRQELAMSIARLEVYKRQYELMKLRIDVWRSQQATERSLS